MRCCVDLVKFILFLTNFLSFLCFLGLLGGTLYILFNGEQSFLGQSIEPNWDQEDPTNAAYFLIIVTLLVTFSFFVLFTFLGCCGAAWQSGCLLGCFIVIQFILFGATVGALVFLHVQHGWGALQEVLAQEMKRNLLSYRQTNLLTYKFWNGIQDNFECCGVESWKIWGQVAEAKGLEKDSWSVPKSCCRAGEIECMYEPNDMDGNLKTVGCVQRILPYVNIIFYGVPVIMFISLVFAFVVSSSVTSTERRRKAATDNGHHSQSHYSIGADEDFQHHQSYPSAPSENLPYNPHYDTTEMQVAIPQGGGYHSGGVGIYNSGPIGSYPTGTVPPPSGAHMPLLHQAPPSYNEVVFRK